MRKLERVYIKTMGCQMNEYDSSKIIDLLRQNFNITLTDDPLIADLLLLNTCSIREKAAEKVFSDLGRWRILKQQRPGIIIGVGGCVASQEGASILTRAPYVDLIFGPQTLHKLPELINNFLQEQTSQIALAWDPIEKFDNLPEPKVDGSSAYLAIMEGCNKYCSFCIVPYTRGREISRNFNSVILEACQLADQGVREITLLGQNVNAYKSYNSHGEAVDLAVLLQYIAEIKGITRIRFTTSHPKEFNHNLIEAFKYIPKLANHLHLPIQSGSDIILAKMKRGYTVLEYHEKIHALKQVRPDISISSDFIVGFPGEKEKDFNATLEVIKAIKFDNSYSFIYSKRPGTPAANYPDDVSVKIKKQRLDIVQALLRQNTIAIGRGMLGSVQAVLVNNVSNQDPKLLCGRTSNNRIVNFIGNKQLIGRMVKVKIGGSATNSLRGELLTEQAVDL